MRFLLFVFFSLHVHAQSSTPTYVVERYWSGTGCSGQQWLMKSEQTACTPGSQTCAGGSGKVSTQCVSGAPGAFSSSVAITGYTSSSCNDQHPKSVVSWANNICVQAGANSWYAGCQNGNLIAVYFLNTNVCLGQAYYYQFAGGQCVAQPPPNVPLNLTTTDYYEATCTAPCFHADSSITSPITGKEMTLGSLRNGEHPECHIPHQVRANGVAVETTCHNGNQRLRVTNDHLVYTPTGLVPAADLKVGDTLFHDTGKEKPCKVVSITAEYNKDYFGLNCQQSTVLADGVLASTFGKYHTVPAFWMRYASAVFGVERASRWGDKVVSLLSRLNLL